MEFGCGLGYVTRWATSVGDDTLGVDLSADQVDQARQLADGKTEFRVGSAYDHGLPPESFDFSYSRWLLTHLNRPVDAMRSIFAVMKPGGLMVCEEADLSAIYAEPPSGYGEFLDIAAERRARRVMLAPLSTNPGGRRNVGTRCAIRRRSGRCGREDRAASLDARI